MTVTLELRNYHIHFLNLKLNKNRKSQKLDFFEVYLPHLPSSKHPFIYKQGILVSAWFFLKAFTLRISDMTPPSREMTYFLI